MWHCAVRGSTKRNRKGSIAMMMMLGFLLLICLRHIAGVNWQRNKYYYSDYSVGEYHSGSLILWPSIKIFYLNHNFNHKKATFWIAGSDRIIFPANHHLSRHSDFLQRRARIPSSFSCQLRSGNPLAQKRESEAVQIVWRFKSTTLGVWWCFYKYVNRSITWRLAHTSPIQNSRF